LPEFEPIPKGRYSIRNLPPGEYFVTTDNALEPGEWFDPVVLERLAVDSARVSIGDAESKQVDVVARKQSG
jgi:hypothetical protein